MDQNTRKVIIDRIESLKRKQEVCLDNIKRENDIYSCCGVKIQELESIMEEIKNMNIQQEINKRVPKRILVDDKDKKKANIFLEFIDKCGDEEIYRTVNVKMPKIGYYIYKNKLWGSWKEFREDLHNWVNGTGYWEDVKSKLIPPAKNVEGGKC